MSLKDPIKLYLDPSDKKQIDLIIDDLRAVCNAQTMEFSSELPSVIVNKTQLYLKIEKV